MNFVKTMKVSGGDYAKVSDRLKEFREQNPNALVETTPTIDGATIIFKAHILKDKSDPYSAEATGHAMGENKGAKAFEKLESISVGRALALLGYLNNGEIASSEEMEEFNEYKDNLILEAVTSIHECQNEDDLKEFWASTNLKSDERVVKAKDTRKAELRENSTPRTELARVV